MFLKSETKRRWAIVAASCLATVVVACEPEERALTGMSPAVEQAFPGEQGPVEKALITTPHSQREVMLQRIQGHLVAEGDILISPAQLAGVGSSEPMRSAQGASTHGAYRWPLGRIPYVFRSDLPADTQAEVNAAINHWHTYTSIRLVPRTTEANYVVFQPGSGCSSYVGMIGGAQAVTLNAACSTGNTIHEIGHAVGLWHEQSRVDRDAHINILWQNITSGNAHNFQTYREQGWTGYWDGSDLGGYDFNSIMHYGSYAFSGNGQPTLLTKAGGTISGQRNGLSTGDIAAVQELYEGSAVAVVRLDSLRVARVVRKPDTNLYYSEWNGSAWTAEVSLGGWVRSSPAMTSWAPDRVDIFMVGTDHAVWHKYKQGSTWSDWESLGGYVTSAPAAVSWGVNRIDLVARGGDNQIHHKYWNGSQWIDWAPLGGYVTSAPAITSWGPGRLDIFVRGGDNAIYQKFYDSTGWYGWYSMGGNVTSAPAAVSWGFNRVDIFARGQDGAVLHRYWGGNSWSDWGSLGGYTTGAPAVTSRGVNQLDVFVRGGAAGLYQQSWTGTEWTGWFSLGVQMY